MSCAANSLLAFVESKSVQIRDQNLLNYQSQNLHNKTKSLHHVLNDEVNQILQLKRNKYYANIMTSS